MYIKIMSLGKLRYAVGLAIELCPRSLEFGRRGICEVILEFCPCLVSWTCLPIPVNCLVAGICAVVSRVSMFCIVC
jgi:hypothetical protein